MGSNRPTRAAIAAQFGALVAVVAVAIWTAGTADWDPALFGVLLAFSVFGDLTAITTPSKLKLSGSFLPMVLAMVFLGGTPAALIGVVTIFAGWLRFREAGHFFLNNVLTFAASPLAAGLAFHWATTSASITQSDPAFYGLILADFTLALAINFTMIASYSCYLDRSSLIDRVRTAFIPVLPSELAAALMAVGIAYLYVHVGLASIALFGVVLITFQYLLGALLISQQRAEELERRSKQLASFQVGMLSAMLRTLDLRDQMTARHSAAVARYSRAIAQRAGYSRQEEELVHIAALLHDIGKFILPDRILKANVPLTDEDWMLIRRHPQQGARVVSSLDGYGPVAEIILAHHERIDGKGYPRGLAGDDIPELARIISVADTYDVMTARDSYRTPVSTVEAMGELRRVAGKQLDPRFVEVFIELLEGKDVSFQHGEAADFEKELALEARIEETADPLGNAGRFGTPSVPVGRGSIRFRAMRAVTFQAAGEVRVEEKAAPELVAADDTVVRVEASGICGSDLHIFHGRVPVEQGFTIGHEFVGTVLAAGADVERVAVGDRVLGCFHTACATCVACLRGDYHRCDHGQTFGHGSHLGDLQGAQAEQLLVPRANLTLRKVPEGMSDEVALFAGDVMGTGYHAVAHAGMRSGDTVAVLGLGPVGLCAVQAALAGGATKVFAIDSVRQRLAMAAEFGATAVHLTEEDPKRTVRAATEKRGVDVVVDAVGDPGPLAMAVSLARDAGTVSGIGAYAGKGEVPLGLAWLKGLTLRLGLANVIAHVDRVLALIEAGKLDPSPLVTHHMKLDEAAEAYALYDQREALKIVLTP